MYYFTLLQKYEADNTVEVDNLFVQGSRLSRQSGWAVPITAWHCQKLMKGVKSIILVDLTEHSLWLPQRQKVYPVQEMESKTDYKKTKFHMPKSLHSMIPR